MNPTRFNDFSRGKAVIVLDQSAAEPLLEVVAGIYESVYTEAPYHEIAEDFAGFRKSWPHRLTAGYFRMALSLNAGLPVGFAFGHALGSNTSWWSGFEGELDPELSHETGDRTFAVIEIAVMPGFRRFGIASDLHSHLLVAGQHFSRFTLLVRPEASPAVALYAKLGYGEVGSIRPNLQGPMYCSMVLPLR